MGSGGESGKLSPRSDGRQHLISIERSISLAAPQMADKIRDEIEEGVTSKPGSSALFMEPLLTCAPNTMVIPPLDNFSPLTQSYIYGKLLDIGRLDDLQRTRALNYHPRQQKAVVGSVHGKKSIKFLESPPGPGPHLSALLPASVMGDGNCCLHAISLALWGIQDRVGTLRKALQGMMTSKERFFHKRWLEQEKAWDAEDAKIIGDQSAIDRPEEEWKKEWEDLKDRCGRNGAFLTQIHLFVLVHVIRRPIIVFSHTEQDDSLCRFRGIYLPLEWPEEDCEKTPIILGYQGSHFVPLVYHLSGWPPRRHEDWPVYIPIEVDGGGLLPVLFTKGRPTRVSGSQHGLMDVTDMKHVETRLTAERMDAKGPVIVRIDLRQACLDARRRLPGKDVPDIISSNVAKLITTYLEQGRKAALDSPKDAPPLQSSDSDLARILQHEEWDSQVAISNGLHDLRLLSPIVSPTDRRNSPKPSPTLMPRFPSFGSSHSSGSSGGKSKSVEKGAASPSKPTSAIPMSKSQASSPSPSRLRR